MKLGHRLFITILHLSGASSVASALCSVLIFHPLSVLPLQATKPRGVVIFVHGHGAYLLHELLRVNVSACAPTSSATLPPPALKWFTFIIANFRNVV